MVCLALISIGILFLKLGMHFSLVYYFQNLVCIPHWLTIFDSPPIPPFMYRTQPPDLLPSRGTIKGTIRCKFRSFLKSPLSNTPKIIYNFCVIIGFNPPHSTPMAPLGGSSRNLKGKIEIIDIPTNENPRIFWYMIQPNLSLSGPGMSREGEGRRHRGEGK